MKLTKIQMAENTYKDFSSSKLFEAERPTSNSDIGVGKV